MLFFIKSNPDDAVEVISLKLIAQDRRNWKHLKRICARIFIPTPIFQLKSPVTFRKNEYIGVQRTACNSATFSIGLNNGLIPVTEVLHPKSTAPFFRMTITDDHGWRIPKLR